MEAGPQGAKQESNFRELPLISAFFVWWFKYIPSRIIYIARKIIVKTFRYFSIDLLLRTLFQPWKRDEIDTTNMALDDKIKVWMMNLVSRLIGAAVRGLTIAVGTLAICGTFVASALSLIGFIALPALSFWLIILGIISRGG